MRPKYQLQVLYPWDEAWYTLEHVGPFWTQGGANKHVGPQAQVYGSGAKFRIIKDGQVVWSE